MLNIHLNSIYRRIKPEDALLLNMLRTEIGKSSTSRTIVSTSISDFGNVESREHVDVCASLLSLAQFGKPPALHQFHSSHADLQHPTTFNYSSPSPSPDHLTCLAPTHEKHSSSPAVFEAHQFPTSHHRSPAVKLQP